MAKRADTPSATRKILTPDEFDGKWHMLYHGFLMTGLPYHVVSDDGIEWRFQNAGKSMLVPSACLKTMTALFSTSEVSWRAVKAEGLPKDYYDKGTAYIIRARTSTDLEEWSEH